MSDKRDLYNCCCKFDRYDGDKIVNWCIIHAEWRDRATIAEAALAASESECERLRRENEQLKGDRLVEPCEDCGCPVTSRDRLVSDLAGVNLCIECELKRAGK